MHGPPTQSQSSQSNLASHKADLRSDLSFRVQNAFIPPGIAYRRSSLSPQPLKYSSRYIADPPALSIDHSRILHGFPHKSHSANFRHPVAIVVVSIPYTVAEAEEGFVTHPQGRAQRHCSLIWQYRLDLVVDQASAIRKSQLLSHGQDDGINDLVFCAAAEPNVLQAHVQLRSQHRPM